MSEEPLTTGFLASPARERAARRKRWFYRNERRLIRVYLFGLVALNLLPLAWWQLNRSWHLEDKLEDRYKEARVSVLKQAQARIRVGEKEQAAQQLVALLDSIGDEQLRATLGRFRTDVLQELGTLELELQRPEQALTRFETIEELDPNDYRGPSGAGHAALALGKPGRAVDEFEASLAINPNQAEVVLALMETHFDAGRRERSLETLDEYLDAVWAMQARLYFSESWPCMQHGRTNFVEFPVVLDGQPHTYRLYPRSGRQDNERELAAAGHVGEFELMLVDEPRIVVELEQFRCLGAATWPASESVLCEARGSSGWEPESGIDDWGPGEQGAARYLCTSDRPRLVREVDLRGEQIGAIEIRMTLHKPVPRALLEQRDIALRQLGLHAQAGSGRVDPPCFDDPQAHAAPVLPGQRGAFSFSVAGHVRKNKDDKVQIQDSLRAAIPRIARVDQALVLTGDMVWEGSQSTFDQLDRYVREPLGIPLYVAVGNHDCHAGGRAAFEERYGATWHTQLIGRSLLLVLDTEAEAGDIAGEQLEVALAAIAQVERDPELDHLFVFVHRALWFALLPDFEPLLAKANQSTRVLVEDPPGAREFAARLLPALVELARGKSVHCFAGDIGSRMPLAYTEHEGVHLIASGNKGAENTWWNHYLRVTVDGQRVEIAVVPLGGVGLEPVQTYTPTWWALHEKLSNPCKGG